MTMGTAIGRRGMIAGLGAAGLGAFLAAPGVASAQAGTDGTLTVGLLAGLQQIHPWNVGSIETAATNLLGFSNLVKQRADGSLEPDACVALPTISSDGLTYTFQLRPDVRFHNGDRMTADDVLYSYEGYLSTAVRRQNLARFVKQVRKRDEMVFELELNKPFAGWLRLLGYEVAIVRKGTDFTNNGPTGESLFRGSRAAGSGPYIPRNFQPDVSVEFEANPDYFGGPPPFRTIKLVRIPSDTTQLASLRAGAIDIASTCPPKDFAEMSKAPGFSGASRFSAGIFYSPLNRSKPPFDNVHLRRAFSCGIDRDYICNEIYSGLVTPSALPAAPTEYWYDAALAKTLDYDPDRAKFHLKEAGTPRGFSFEATIPVPSAYIEARDAAIAMQANLAEVGIRMTIRQTDFATMYANARAGDFTCFPHPSMQSSVEDYLIYNNYHRDGVQAQWMGKISPEYDALVEESFRYIEPEKKLPALRKVVQTLADVVPAVWIGRVNAFHLWRSDVKDFGPRYAYFQDLTRARRG
jgi:peptide/nickel transport system substrate-binding protein